MQENHVFGLPLKRSSGQIEDLPGTSGIIYNQKSIGSDCNCHYDLFAEDFDLSNIKASPNPSPASAAILVFLDTAGRMVSPYIL